MRSKTAAATAIIGGAAALFYAGRIDARRQTRLDAAKSQQPLRVIVIGAGFGGLNAAVALARHPAIDLTVIDAQNHHLFQPLLYQVATAALSPADIASPVRDVIPATPNTRVMMGAVTGIDIQAQTVICDGHTLPYDALIIATGSQPSYFGNNDWEKHAPGLKSLHDALDLRGRILLAFERACTAEDPAERDRFLTFVLIGAGPTGVEMAGSIAELAHEVLASDHELSQATLRIVLVEAGSRVLAEFPQNLSDHAVAALRQLGVTIQLGSKVMAIKEGVVQL